jgi:hypothetical protein
VEPGRIAGHDALTSEMVMLLPLKFSLLSATRSLIPHKTHPPQMSSCLPGDGTPGLSFPVGQCLIAKLIVGVINPGIPS